jgi:hypothetical protein
VRDCPAAVGPAAVAAAAAASPRAPLAPLTRREATVRDILEKHGDPLMELARVMATTADVELKVMCAKALAPYLYPQQKAVELSGAGGEQLVVEVRKA